MSEKNVPNVRFKGFSESWEQRKLENMATFLKGKGYSKSDLVNKGYPIILYGRMYTNYETVIDQITDTFVTDISDAQISTSGDVIVPGSGETAMDISRASNVKISGVVLGGDINIIKPNLKSLDSTFLAYTISNGKQQKELTKRAQGKSVVHLHNSDLKKVVLNVPSKAEQIKIATLLQKIESAIASNQRKLDQLKEVKKLLMQKIFDQEWRFKGFTDPWEQRQLKEDVQRIKSYSFTREVETEKNTGMKYIHYGDIHTGIADKINDPNVLPNIHYGDFNQLDTNDVVVADASEDYKGIADASILLNKSNFQVIAGLHTISLRPQQTKLDPLFLYYLLKTNSFKHHGYRVGTGLKVFGITFENLTKFEYLAPKVAEQNRIAMLINIVDEIIASNQQKLDQLKEMKKWFMQNMFV